MSRLQSWQQDKPLEDTEQAVDYIAVVNRTEEVWQLLVNAIGNYEKRLCPCTNDIDRPRKKVVSKP